MIELNLQERESYNKTILIRKKDIKVVKNGYAWGSCTDIILDDGSIYHVRDSVTHIKELLMED